MLPDFFGALYVRQNNAIYFRLNSPPRIGMHSAEIQRLANDPTHSEICSSFLILGLSGFSPLVRDYLLSNISKIVIFYFHLHVQGRNDDNIMKR